MGKKENYYTMIKKKIRNFFKPRTLSNLSNKKGQIWISAVLYILIIVVAITIIMNTGLPVLEKMKDKTIFAQAKNALTNLDQYVQRIKDEGQGSQRVIPIEIRKGKVSVEGNRLVWQLETEAEILESR